jgi:lysylphosphatidylglycerol synthetase-like protein (DUF2156 family)
MRLQSSGSRRRVGQPMLTLHVVISFVALLAGVLLLIALCRGRHQPTSAAALLACTVLISASGLALPSPPGTPTPDPARILSFIELVLVVIATVTLYIYHLAHAWRGIFALAVTLIVYFNAFVAVTQAFLKIAFLHALAPNVPNGNAPPFLVAQLLTLVLFVVVGVTAFRRFRAGASPIAATVG